MTIADILGSMVGVWEGTYTVMRPDATLIQRYDSRQEGLLDGHDWTEQVTYFTDDGPVVQRFHAVVDGDRVAFGNDEIWGRTARAGEDMIVFTFGWTNRPGERIVECSRPDGDYRTRLWQHFEDSQLTKLTLIEERRDPAQQPERWYQAG